MHTSISHPPVIAAVFQNSTTPLWIKINTDGMSKGNPGSAACGDVFRGFNRAFHGGFSMPSGVQCCAKILAIVKEIDIVVVKVWTHV